ncbi:FtsB family cell division protein [Segetibacter koreensis]|uniref:FtsB family cell division protein n=1 Tax=Segetibacter koreensis TaxID=398037 RepID=UPI0003638E07|nr:septum formation initiator family protein [Segetibacter koreensis]
MNRFSFLFKILKNKYAVSLIVFIVWILFFDRNDLFTQWDRKQELQKLETSTSFYEKEIANTKKDLMDLNNKPAILEKFAREKFYLKRANEDLFLINDSADQKN